jgi:hypothetical protein
VVQRKGSEADHSLRSFVKIKNEWSYISTPLVRRHGVGSDNSIFVVVVVVVVVAVVVVVVNSSSGSS